MPVNPNIEDQLKDMYEKKKKDEELNSQSSFSYFSDEDRLILDNGYTVLRVLDMPVSCESSFIKCDDKQVKLFKFPSLEENPEFIMYKILDKVIYQVWKGTAGDGKPIIECPVKDQYPDIYWMVYNNGDMMPGQYGYNGWGVWKKIRGKYTAAASQTTCFMNAINRREFSYTRDSKDEKGERQEETKAYGKDWCVQNKHSLLLCKSPKSVGAAITVANLLIKDIFPNYGNFVKYDIAIHRMKADPYYQLYKAETLENNQEVFPHVVKGDLTPEEQAVELYNTADMIKPSTHTFIYEHLKASIGKIDSALGTTFLKELEDLASAEGGSISPAGNGGAEQKSPEPEQKPVENEQKSPESEQKPVENEQKSPDGVLKNTTETEEKVATETPAPEVPIREVSNSSNGDSVDLESVKKLTGVLADGNNVLDLISEDERKLIKGVSPDGKSIEFNTKDITACPYCRKLQPALIATYCILCGKKF